MQIQKFISPLISSQFPAFYKEYGPNFIAFIEAYYEWMEQSGQSILEARNLIEYGDIDDTTNAFVNYFKSKYMKSIPSSISADKRLLTKHIIDLYRAKGTDRGYKLLFRLLFDEDIDVYNPSEHIFKASDATWYIPKYIEVSSNPYLYRLVGKKIISSGGASAIVDSYFRKIVNGKTVNILYLSGIQGIFHFNEQIYCEDYPEITFDTAPIVFGSLSTVSITNGGVNFSVGDKLSINGTGLGGLAKVSSVKTENGKVTFTLIDGGYGFSRDAIVTVTGGGGAGATFQIGDITDSIILALNTDGISGMVNANLEIYTQGFDLSISGNTGNFTNGERVTASANVIHIDVNTITGQVLTGESLSNASIGVSGLTVYKADGNMLYITGTDSNITNANLISNIILSSNTTGSVVSLNYKSSKLTVSGNGLVNSAASNSTHLFVYNGTTSAGYYIPGMTITGVTSAQTAVVSNTKRLTDWGYFVAASDIQNLDSRMGDVFRVIYKEVGRITYLSNINPGIGYSTDPTIEIVEPYVHDLRINDGFGGFWGYDASVTGKAGTASGIVTAVEVTDSGFGYEYDEPITLSKLENSTSVVSGVAIVNEHGEGSGRWEDNKSFLSDEMYIQDSDFYQAFSYEIRSTKMLEAYEKIVKTLVHPTGTKLFGRFINSNDMTDGGSSISDTSLFQGNVVAIPVTADITTVRASERRTKASSNYTEIII
jgi:hypothetical protein